VGLLDRWARWRRRRTLEQRAIPDALWLDTLAQFPFLGRRSLADLQRLREMATLFLAKKEFSGAGGFVVTDEIAVAIAAQACLPVLELGLACYDGFVGIVVHPDVVAAPRSVTDEDGVVHEYVEELAGEAVDGGPLMLAWSDVENAGDSAAWGYNVVVHEFVHVLDRHAAREGLEPEGGLGRWSRRLQAAHERFATRVDAGEDPFLDPYGAEAPQEFFAVAAEAFFVAPEDLAREEPEVYELLAVFFRQRPAEAGARRPPLRRSRRRAAARARDEPPPA
jgi:Mlc titration factor MtfA (ptsG expression regulator)